jgi:hypothetical protein
MKPHSDPQTSDSKTPAKKPAGKADEKHADKPAAATWPFQPGSQGDSKPLAPKPVQKPGWNARQFRI